MFREMRRSNQLLDAETVAKVLTEARRGTLSVLGDDGYPYGMPINFVYDPESGPHGSILFHAALVGHKIDAITACDKVSYCVMDEGFRRDGEWALNINSVVVFGRMRIVEDEEKKREICTNLVRKFTDDEAYLQKELANAFGRVNCLELAIEHMTGKLVNES